MKMSRFEKRFINAARHSRRVAESAEQRLPIVPYRGRLTYLDVGCGNGMTALHLATACGFDVTGIDVDPDQIRLARDAAGSRADVRFLVGDATHLPFDAAEFDVVATNKTTHHIPEWKTVLAEMVRVLKPGGYVIYGDLVVPSWLARIGRSVAGGLAGFVTRAELDGFIRQQGLTVVQEAGRIASYEGVWRRPTT
jgi:ubiquinone/menaquinone biosynthesis C-methylase UbiE